MLQFKAIAKFVRKWQHIWIVLWRTDVSSLCRFQKTSLLIYRFSYFIIIIIGICFEIMSANCVYMRKRTWFYLSFFLNSWQFLRHISILRKWMVCEQWCSVPIHPTHYVGFFSAFLHDPESLAQPWMEALFDTILVLFLILEIKTSNILSFRIMSVTIFIGQNLTCSMTFLSSLKNFLCFLLTSIFTSVTLKKIRNEHWILLNTKRYM